MQGTDCVVPSYSVKALLNSIVKIFPFKWKLEEQGKIFHTLHALLFLYGGHFFLLQKKKHFT